MTLKSKLMTIAAAAVLSCTLSTAQAQYLRLTKATSKHGLYFDMNKLYNFNLYEYSRWGAGLRYIYSFDGHPAGRQLWADAYGGYGVNDYMWKYGAAISYKAGGNSQTRVGLSFVNDLEHAGSRNLESYTLTNLSANSTYMAIRFSHIMRAAVTVESRVAPRLNVKASLRASVEEYLFNKDGMVYPLRNGGYREHERDFLEAAVVVDYNNRAKLSLRAGWTNLPFEKVVSDMGWLNDRNVFFVRGIAQYSRTYPVGKKGQFNLFCQIGASTEKTPYSRMFDMGGTFGSGFYFTNAFLTLRPAEMAANVYAQVCGRLAAVKPLWDLYGYSAPKAYIQANFAWGALWIDGELVGSTRFDGLPLQAPEVGLGELSAGVTNLLNLNGLQIGAAAAYQITPHWASYHRDDPNERLALLASATLIF